MIMLLSLFLFHLTDFLTSLQYEFIVIVRYYTVAFITFRVSNYYFIYFLNINNLYSLLSSLCSRPTVCSLFWSVSHAVWRINLVNKIRELIVSLMRRTSTQKKCILNFMIFNGSLKCFSPCSSTRLSNCCWSFFN